MYCKSDFLPVVVLDKADMLLEKGSLHDFEHDNLVTGELIDLLA